MYNVFFQRSVTTCISITYTDKQHLQRLIANQNTDLNWEGDILGGDSVKQVQNDVYHRKGTKKILHSKCYIAIK